ncbi:amidase domain-containing protein [Pseudalkalibacillus berkeleyi]|uniref:Amidase domain-containing protein n=1 Tax=Pseudalkalibacillus berkeleyi TaxID=1069813 RepID=A0ABS9GWD7_9BACL|nr:amidase domain-containing protein [Pseudalkalibacillus berkeleyi]MCF6136111.1 amidase domain-containing protein [Pseudalkalibacillus berkeleyi]
MDWLTILQQYIEEHNASYTTDITGDKRITTPESNAIIRRARSMKDRNAVIVNAQVKAKIVDRTTEADKEIITYWIQRSYLIKQTLKFYVEECLEKRKATIKENEIIKDESAITEGFTGINLPERERDEEVVPMPRYRYNRLEAVKYAERWWNSHNPVYKLFENDCTNFISQCLHAGGAPMRGYPNRSKGWWYRSNNWSYSWSVANTMRWYLSGSKQGLRGEEVRAPELLIPGDVICYDFDGDGRWQHNTIVVAKDEMGMPLVNAHTHNSRMRYWDYTDSTAYTPEIKYKFFKIVDG